MTETADNAQARITERRIAQLTLVLGAAGAVAAGALFSPRVGAGVLIGAALAWVNFRWLAQALDSLVEISSAAEGGKGRVPVGSALRMAGRYVLIAVVVYVIFVLLRIPVLSMLVGLCALGAATMVASLYEILRPAG